MNEDTALIAALTRESRLLHDSYHTYLTIRRSVLNLLLNSVEGYFGDNPQPFLLKLYRALLSMTYFGLFRIGEVTNSSHVVKAWDVHIGTNKNKLLFVLHTSKTHDKSKKPQLIKVSEVSKSKQIMKQHAQNDVNCPFRILKEYLQECGRRKTEEEQFFVFSDNSPVQRYHFRQMLKKLTSFNNWTPVDIVFMGYMLAMPVIFLI